MPATELRTVAFDWKDLVLFAIGYAEVVAVLVAWSEVAGEPSQLVTRIVIVLGLGAPLVLRRVLFGWPALPPPKDGFGWSLLSMLGIFVALIGMLTAGMGVFPLWDGRDVHGGLVAGGLCALAVGSMFVAMRYPRSNLPEARVRR